MEYEAKDEPNLSGGERMWHASFEWQVSNLCRELIQAKNDVYQLEERSRELNELLEERAVVLRAQLERVHRTAA